jgi:hypothetical protein
MSSNVPFKLDEVNKRINEINITQPIKNEKVLNQIMTFPKLDDKMLDIQSPVIKMTSGGFPQKGNPLYDTFLQRANSISIPIQKGDELHSFLINFQKKVEGMDELIPEDMKGKIEIQDFVREYENKKKDMIDYSMRIRSALDIIDMKSEKYVIKTTLWRKDGKTVTEIPVKTVEDVEKEIKYGSTLQFIFRVNKLYISTKNEGTKKDPKYKMGVTFKIMAVQIIGGASAANNVNYGSYTFNNDDEADELEIENMSVIDTSKLDEVDENDEDEEAD